MVRLPYDQEDAMTSHKNRLKRLSPDLEAMMPEQMTLFRAWALQRQEAEDAANGGE
jgi:hypothetical protein